MLAQRRPAARMPASETVDLSTSAPELAVASDFEAIVEATRQVLLAFGNHWRQQLPDDKMGLAIAANELAADPAQLSREGFAWSREVGLRYVLPEGALQCRPISQSLGRDGLSPSSMGGPVLPTHSGVFVAPTPDCGFGLFVAAVPIRKDEVIGEYLGEVRSYDVWCEEIQRRKTEAHGFHTRVPFIREELYSSWAGSGPRGKGVVIDAHNAGNAMRFINCSCRPNCTFKSFGLGGQKHYRIRVIATRDLAPFEQLSVDYGWYFDEETLQEIRAQALEAYREDLPSLAAIGELLPHEADSRQTSTQTEPLQTEQRERSEALCLLSEALLEARGPPLPVRTKPIAFLRRFVQGEALAQFLEKGGNVKPVSSYLEIPDAFWPIYEVVGAERVGLPCRCALDPTLNIKGICSGIIGRPLQAVCSGREDIPAIHFSS